MYSNGATTEGGAERNASVSRYWPTAASTPRATSQRQCARSIGTQPGAARPAANSVMRLTVQNTTLAVVSVRVSTRTAIALSA